MRRISFGRDVSSEQEEVGEGNSKVEETVCERSYKKKDH